VRGDGYSRIEQWLHWLALEPRATRQLAFELECQYALDAAVPADGAVYVCGLARSGTTILLRALAHLDTFRSLTYRDMPFVLSPNLWRRLAAVAQRAPAPAERAHGDGIVVDFDSPEAFEEVYWRTFCEQPADSATFGRVVPSAESLSGFADYRALIANPRGSGTRRRYLSKNNNNLTRLNELARDPTAVILIPYRDPVACARSLHRQHRHFCAAQASNAFTRRYMGWLGHHEFGLDHKPFDFAAPRMNAALVPGQPDYWLDYWIAVHDSLSDRLGGRTHLIEHDSFCARPAEMMGRILEILDVDADASSICREVRAAAAEPPPAEFNPDLVDRAARTFKMINNLKNNIP
jgi:hypothetical protein